MVTQEAGIMVEEDMVPQDMAHREAGIMALQEEVTAVPDHTEVDQA
jgi:hypothetical protein